MTLEREFDLEPKSIEINFTHVPFGAYSKPPSTDYPIISFVVHQSDVDLENYQIIFATTDQTGYMEHPSHRFLFDRACDEKIIEMNDRSRIIGGGVLDLRHKSYRVDSTAFEPDYENTQYGVIKQKIMSHFFDA